RPPTELMHAEPGSRRFPDTFRTRIVHWSLDGVGEISSVDPMGDWANDPRLTMERIHADLRSAYGRDPLVDSQAFAGPTLSSGWNLAHRQIPAHLRTCPDVEVIDYIDAVFQVTADIVQRDGGADPVRQPRELGAKLNRIFEEEGVGYRLTDGRLTRFDDEITYTEAMTPALAALATGRFGAAHGEFVEAIAAFGRGAWRDTLTHANAALESVLQVITGEKGTAGELIAKLRRDGTIPAYLGGGVEHIAKLMSLVPAARGQQGSAHGLGERPVEADERLARLVLTTAAASVTFLADDGA
ncbi:MAG: hypothetical protein JWL77_7158, partial [Chthonomonadaceae bacterium]|nr:hypothetical protein [Chthonomonadaceae bacterium]